MMTKEEITGEFTEGMNKLLEMISYREYTHEKAISYIESMKSVFQRFITESKKQDCDIFELIRMADILNKIWSVREKKEMEELRANLAKNIEKNDEYFDSMWSVKDESDADIMKKRDCVSESLVRLKQRIINWSPKDEIEMEELVANLVKKNDEFFDSTKDVKDELDEDIKKKHDCVIDSTKKLKQKIDAEDIIIAIQSFQMLVSRMYCILLETMDEPKDAKEYVYGQFTFWVPMSQEIFEKVEEWFGKQNELDEILGRA